VVVEQLESVRREQPFTPLPLLHRYREKSKAGWLDRRRERKREKQLRTGDWPEKIAERRKRDDPMPGEAAARVGLGSYSSGDL